MTASNPAGKAVYDAGTKIVTGDFVIRVEELNLDIAFKFTPGRSGTFTMPTPTRFEIAIGLDLAKGWPDEPTGSQSFGSTGVPHVTVSYTVRSLGDGRAEFSWQVVDFDPTAHQRP